jgi:hypothetical protein
MLRHQLAASVAMACLSALTMRMACAQQPRADTQPRAVIELFTSQGCSSCPPADKLVAEYAHDPSVIAMSLAVDYWDYLGWKDTLALNGHSNRQRAYARARGDRQVYTPQAVIDGEVHALGSDQAAIERAIRQGLDEHHPLTLPVTMTKTGDALTVSVPAAKDGAGQAEVWLCPVTRSIPVSIGRGENSGRTLTYTNVVRRWIKLGDWNGQPQTFHVPLKDIQSGEIDSVVVMVQAGVASTPKTVLGAAQVSIR